MIVIPAGIYHRFTLDSNVMQKLIKKKSINFRTRIYGIFLPAEFYQSEKVFRRWVRIYSGVRGRVTTLIKKKAL